MLELPLDALRAGRTRTRIERRGITFETDAYIVDEHLIWGATARILENLLASRLRWTAPRRWPAAMGAPRTRRAGRATQDASAQLGWGTMRM